MSQNCTRCEQTGFLNYDQLADLVPGHEEMDHDELLAAVQVLTAPHDVSVCDCCGDGESVWHGVPGEHYNEDDPSGPDGPYADNGGLCDCH